MSFRKIILRTILFIILAALLAGVWYAWLVFPLISGYGAKNMASAVYLQHRNPKDVIKEDLSDFPKSLGTFMVNERDSSVTGSVWGFAKRKVIYRHGFGCTVINDFTEAEIRARQFNLPLKPLINTDTIPWPYRDKIIDSIPSFINKIQLGNAVNNVMNESKNGTSAFTRAVLVLYDGKIIAPIKLFDIDHPSITVFLSNMGAYCSAIIFPS